MKDDAENIQILIQGMRNAYSKGENTMEYARKMLENEKNEVIATLISYDLQSGSYISAVKSNPDFHENWSKQLAEIISPLMDSDSSILEVGCGEATTMGGLINKLDYNPKTAFGFDISWSRIHHGNKYLTEKGVNAKLFVGDLFSIPLMPNSVDIVYSSHSLEPNGGKETEAISELLRVSRRWVVLIEPMYELASSEARKRMDTHGYVKNLKGAAEECGAKVIQHTLLKYTNNPLNPSGLLVLEKQEDQGTIKEQGTSWRCPITGVKLSDEGDVFVSEDVGLVYPVLRGIPMLRSEHAIIASALKKNLL